jgi:hypothetical protein
LKQFDVNFVHCDAVDITHLAGRHCGELVAGNAARPRTEKALDCKRNLPSEPDGQGLSTQAKPMIGTAEA